MRKLLLFVLPFVLFACVQTPGYQVKLQLSGAEGTAYLSKRVSGEWINLDSAVFENGSCQMKGTVKNPEICYLSISSKKDRLPFFIENSAISISGQADSLSKAMITGSVTQDELKAIQDQLNELEKQGMIFYKESKENAKEGNTAKADSLMALADNIFNQIDSQQKEYIKSHTASFVSPYLLSQVYYDMEADVLNEYLSGFDKKLDSVSTVISMKDRVTKLKLVAIGQIAPDFTLNDVDGNPVKLSDVYSKNEYTLVDFWASWCGPCRRENPNVVSVFNSFKTKGFGVFGVSLDSDKDKWIKAIADDRLTWPHVSDLKGWKNEAAAIYSVNSIPANLLIDKNGKIVDRNLREAKLGEKIAELLK